MIVALEPRGKAPGQGCVVMADENDIEDIIEIPVNGVLDLHTFRPRDVKELLPDYLDACREKGILQVRVIHGKGQGVLRESVHAILGRLPGVERYHLAQEDAGGWGATLVELKRG